MGADDVARFLAARAFLFAHRDDYATAYRDFRWPELTEFNWALDHIDAIAADPERGARRALWIVESNGSEAWWTFAELAERSNRVANRLREWGVPEPVIGAAILCTSELTTNALLHAGTPAQVHIDLSAERLLVSVADTGTRGAVTRAHTDALSSRGRGLGLIEELSDSWGTDPTVRGSTVWFEMLLREPRAG